MREKFAPLVVALALTVVGVGTFYEFAIAGRWIFAVVFGLVIPIGTGIEWKAANEQGAGNIAGKFVALVLVALLAASG